MRQYAEPKVANGLIIILPAALRGKQRRLFGLALDCAQQQKSLVNLLIAVQADGSLGLRNWPKP